MTKKFVVLAAFACDPNIPSEPTIGWAYLRTWTTLAESSGDVTVLAVMNMRSKIATDLRLSEEGFNPYGVLQTVGIELPKALKFLKNPYLTRFEYLVWNFQTKRYLRALPLHYDIALARHVTFASELLPTPITALRERSYTVWGPVGSSGVAAAFRIRPRHPQWRSHFIFQKLRDAISRRQSRKIGKSVDHVLATSTALANDLQSVGIRSEAFPNTRLDSKFVDLIVNGAPDTDSTQVKAGKHRPLQLLCVGNLVYLKRFELAIATLTDPRLRTARLRIIGKPAPGKENYLERIAVELNVQDRVEFVGQLPQEDVVRAMMRADALIHPSTREGGSGVVGEATAVGLPVVCFEGTGAAVVLDYAGGHGVEVNASSATSVSLLSDAVVAASRMPHNPAGVWRGDRYSEVEARLLDEVSVRNARTSPL
jgi:glycosyltransferase involved in cell wall biosynthesis